MSHTRECERCAGKGTIPAHKNVLGGVCFLCGGKGKIVTKAAPRKTPKWLISATTKDTGEHIAIFSLRARNAEIARQMAVIQLARGNGYIPTSATVAEG
jgi:hypothetical protein